MYVYALEANSNWVRDTLCFLYFGYFFILLLINIEIFTVSISQCMRNSFLFTYWIKPLDKLILCKEIVKSYNYETLVHQSIYLKCF